MHIFTRLARLSLALLLLAPTLAHAATEVSPSMVTPQASQAVETSHVVPNGVQFLHGASVTTGAAAGFFLILNASADPGNGAVLPLKCVQVAANSTVALSADPDTGWAFAKLPGVGSPSIVLVFSTTGCFTETQSATAYFSWQ
jgi:hypothetical protein